MAAESDSGGATYFVKLTCCGERAVGTTSVFARLHSPYHEIDTTEPSLPRVDFRVRSVLSDDLGGRVVKLQLWDIEHSPPFQSTTTAFLRKTDAVALVFSLTDRSSLKDLEYRWLHKIGTFGYANGGSCQLPRRYKEGTRPVLILIGNKADLVDKRVVSAEEIAAFCERNGIALYRELSAVTSPAAEFEELLQAVMREVLHVAGVVGERRPGAVRLPAASFKPKWEQLVTPFGWITSALWDRSKIPAWGIVKTPR